MAEMENVNTNGISRWNINGYDLKMIAVFSMLLDHIGASLVWRWISATGAYEDVVLSGIYEMLRYVGRMAFPLYCFLLIEGFCHTRSVGKYALRLGIFALISEIPFDLALNGGWWDISSNNVFGTLLIGLLLVWGISYVEKFYAFWKERKWDVFIGTLAAVAVAILLIVPAIYLAEVALACDYGMGGVLAILAMYFFRNYPVVGYTLGILLLYIFSGSTEILALVMLLPLSCYDGTRGEGNKYLFYGFYPVHLLMLGLLCLGLGI